LRLGGKNLSDWYYIGHYGQLGPLTRDQIDELVTGGVILRETFVWKAGMNDWIRAELCAELQSAFFLAAPAEPPPRPMPPTQAPSPPGTSTSSLGHSWMNVGAPIQPNAGFQLMMSTIKSDRSRAAAGILQLILPGTGRMYLGYHAYGALQLIVTIFSCGFLWVWSFIDGIIILTGGVKLDGYGRQIVD
jgi:hypothetical protein